MLVVLLLNILALACTIPAPLPSMEERSCPHLCRCLPEDGLLHVHCEGRGLTHFKQMGGFLRRPFKLHLQGNVLRRLQTDTFLSLGGAVAIDLGSNTLQDIEPGAFNGLATVRRLHLQRNKLEVFRNDTFVGLQRLEYLQADSNLLRRIDSGSLGHLQRLRVLILNDNLLASLPSALFSNLSLTHLDLRGNRLRLLAYRGTLEFVGRSLVELQLEENPWRCSCELAPMKVWLDRIPYTALVEDVTCESPFRLHGKDLRELGQRELCPALSGAELERRFTLPTQQPRFPKAPPTPHPPPPGQQTHPPVPIVCPDPCQCRLHIADLGLTVRCKDKGLRTAAALKPRPLNARKLYLSGNLIQRIRRGDFWNFSSLHLLHLANNRISALEEAAFCELVQLQSLHLNGNDLQQLTAGTFSGLHSLRYLYLEHNALREIQPSTFSTVPSLQLLFLNGNLLHSLAPGALAGTALRRLNLRSNELWHLPVSGVLERLGALVQLDLQRNPWSCTCAVLPLKRWLEHLSPAVLVGEVLCRTPEALLGQDMRWLEPGPLCATNSPTTATSPTPLPPIPLSVLILSLLVLLVSAALGVAAVLACVLRGCGRRRQDMHLPHMHMECGVLSSATDDARLPEPVVSITFHAGKHVPVCTDASPCLYSATNLLTQLPAAQLPHHLSAELAQEPQCEIHSFSLIGSLF